MQVTLNLDVERMLPDFVRRRFIVKQQTLLPNQRRGGVLGKIRMSDPTLNRITKGVRAGFSNEVKLVFFFFFANTKLKVLSQFCFDSYGNISTQDDTYDRVSFFPQSESSQLGTRLDDVLGKMKAFKDQLKQVSQELEETKSLLRAIAKKNGVEMEQDVEPERTL